MQTLSFRAMNTSVLLAAEGQGWAQVGLWVARKFIQSSEKRFSRFLPGSELSRLNRRAGQWVSVSADMFDLLQHSLIFYNATDGLFDPSILPDLKRIGYDRTMDEIRARGAVSSPASLRTPRSAFCELELDSKRRRIRLPAGMEIDLGGIAKGWIAEHAATLLAYFAPAGAVNAGGDMVFFGQRAEEERWLVCIEHPLNPTRTLSTFCVTGGAVATSSIVKRAWTHNGQMRHHLIDPRTGEPAQTEWLSVTVFAPELLTAEVYAKVLLIAGPSRAASLLARHPELEYLAVTADEQITGAPHLLSRTSTLWLEKARSLTARTGS